MDRGDIHTEPGKGEKIMRKNIAIILVAGALISCQSDHPTEAGANVAHERAGEIRLGKNYSGLRITISDEADSVLAGPGGDGAWFVSRILAGQAIILSPDASPLGQTIRLRVFTTGETSAKNIAVTVVEGALENGDVETPEGLVLWDR